MSLVISINTSDNALIQTLLDANALLEDVEFALSTDAQIIDDGVALKFPDGSTYARPLYIPEIIEAAQKLFQNNALSINGLELKGKTIKFAGVEQTLSGTQAKILHEVMTAFPEAVGKEELRLKILGYSKEVETNTLENHISKLRQKLKAVGSSFEIVSKDGYVLRVM